MSKIKIGFEVTDNYKNGGFREFIQSLLKDERFEVYIISNNDITSYVLSIGESLQIPEGRIFIVNFTNDKIETIQNLGINIYLENLKYVADQIENTTDCYAVYIDQLPNTYYVKPKYIVEFERVLEEINRDNCEKATCKE